MDSISSRQNPVIKHVVKLLSSAQYRAQQGLAVAEGIHLVQSLQQSGHAPRQLLVSESGRVNAEIVDLVAAMNVRGIDCVTLKDSLFAAISDVNTKVGVMLVFELPTQKLPDIINTDAILLENIQDPGNVGTILRTAAAAGVRKVYMSAGCASVWSPKVLRAGMGAQFGLEIFEGVDLAEVIRVSQVTVLATSLHAETSIYDQDMRPSNAWLFGSEGQGVSSELESLVESKVIIPQVGQTIESLNVAASVAVCLYEQLRQRTVVS